MSPAPFGLRPSPITPRSLAASTRLSDPKWDTDGGSLVWLEGRSGQGVLVAQDVAGLQAPRDLTADLSVRAKVGYGGGDFTVGHGAVFFAEAASGRLYRQELAGGPARPITPAFGAAAAPALAPDGASLLYVHSAEGRDVVALADAHGRRWPQVVAEGHDFYMQPCWSPDGAHAAYITWDHPNMPWDGTLLYLCPVEGAGRAMGLGEPHLVAGGPEVAVFQPSFSPDGRYLAYVSDESGWGQIYLYELATGAIRQLTHVEAEHATPAWAQGMATFAWSPSGAVIYVTRNERGIFRLIAVPVDGGPEAEVPGLGDYSWLGAPAVSAGGIALQASSSVIPTRLVLAAPEGARVLRRAAVETVAPAELAAAQPVSWPGPDGVSIHGLLYLPPGFRPGAGQAALPPAVVLIHGGPTAQAVAGYDGDAQFFATRGYAILDINYRGSTGYGRAYMLALRGQWGVCDVEDAASGARFLGEGGYADPARIVIAGGSAGGYTVLEALCRAPGVFRAGLCSFGVANLFTLAADTHKFEAHYLDRLLGPLPQAGALYRERSPIFHAERLVDPVAVFQGTDDQVVPRAQSDSIVESLRRRGVPHVYHVYEGEGHGWRKRETIEAYWTSVDAFLRQHVIFG